MTLYPPRGGGVTTTGPLTFELVADDEALADFKRGFDSLASILADFPEASEAVCNDLFCGNELRADVFTLKTLGATGTDRMLVAFEFTDTFREFVMALVARECDRKRVQVAGN